MTLIARPTVLPEFGSASTEVVEPSSGRKASGYQTVGGIADFPVLDWDNWVTKTTYEWIRHLSERILTGSKISMDQSQANQDLTGITIPPADFGAFELKLSVRVRATTNRFALITLIGLWNDQTGAWEVAQNEISDQYSEIDLNVTAAGQVQYTSPAYAGFVSVDSDFHCTRIPQLHT